MLREREAAVVHREKPINRQPVPRIARQNRVTTSMRRQSDTPRAQKYA